MFSIPPPNNFRWEDLLAIMRDAGFKEACGGGSHYAFEHPSGYIFHMSKTHPSGILKRYQINMAKEALQIIEGNKND